MVKKQGKTVAGLMAAAMLAAVPLSPAEANGGRQAEAIGLGLLGAAVVGSVAAMAAGVPPPQVVVPAQPVYAAPVYAPPPVYYAPAPVVYAQPYYARPPVVYYAPGYYRRY
jgi:hypothetical protein